MARRIVSDAGQSYEIADDAPRPAASWLWAVLRTRVVDELTLAPPHCPIRITTHTPHCVPRIGDDGICGLVARPADVSAALVDPQQLTATIEVDGYLPQVLDGAIDAARRILNASTNPGATTLTIAPPDPSLEQFIPGRGVMIERKVHDEAEQFARQADPLAGPLFDTVPLIDTVQPPRALNTHVAGVPIVLEDQALHLAEPVRIRGRARLQPTAGPSPVVHIGIDRVWWTFPERMTATAWHSPDFVSFSAPMAFPHDAGVAAENCTISPFGGVGAAGALTLPAWSGTTIVSVFPWNGLSLNPVGGDVLQIEADNSNERELVITDGFDAASTLLAPVRIRLRTPLAFPHAGSTRVTRITVAAAPPVALNRSVVPGDRVLFLNTVAALPTENVLRITGGTPTSVEMRFARCVPTYDGTSFLHQVNLDSDGTFELPPLARVAKIRFRVQHANNPLQPPIEYFPNYRGDNTLQILITP